MRRFTRGRRVYLGDASMTGRLRLDAFASYLQDVAADDAEAAHLPDDRGWVVRRMAIEVDRLPAVYEDVELETWCSGVGGRWAERTTTLTGARGVGVRGVCLRARAVWVYVNLVTGAPEPLPPELFAVYGEGIRSNRVRARLVHPGPVPDGARSPWSLRATDFDVLGHVNNAVYWAPVEEELTSWLDGRPVSRAEIEFRAGIDPGDAPDLVVERDEALRVWFMVGDDVRASVIVEAR